MQYSKIFIIMKKYWNICFYKEISIKTIYFEYWKYSTCLIFRCKIVYYLQIIIIDQSQTKWKLTVFQAMAE